MDQVHDAAADCSPDTLDAVTNTDQVFTAPLLMGAAGGELSAPEPWRCYVDEGSVTRTALAPPTFPALVILSEDDRLVDTAIERGAFSELCALGHNLVYLECENAGHEEGFFFSIDDALDFIDEQLQSPTAQACMVRAAESCSSEI